MTRGRRRDNGDSGSARARRKTTAATLGLAAAVILVAMRLVAAAGSPRTGSGGPEPDSAGISPGYTLFAPIFSTTTYLVDLQGRVVHSWQSDLEPGQAVYLLKNGHLLRSEALGRRNPVGQGLAVQGREQGRGSGGAVNRVFHGGGAGGRVTEYSWDGDIVWQFDYSSDDHLSHHDVERLPNGNILLIAWERKSAAEAIVAGRDPALQGSADLWTDHLIEVKPTGKTGGEIVWQWHVWDHLVQEHDPGAANFGKVADHAERIDLNYCGSWSEQLSQDEREQLQALGYLEPTTPGPGARRIDPDWTHINAVDYNPELDQIVLSVLGFNEIWVIDHSTTREEAATSSGGKSGKGGDLLYRWGNPAAYGAGTRHDQQLFGQHDAQWIAPPLPGAGNLLVFNNGRGRRSGAFSSVDELAPPVDHQGRYSRQPGRAFGPIRPLWTYSAAGADPSFSSTHISGAQRMANGNTLVCSGASGTLYEVTAAGAIVWTYCNPFGRKRSVGPGFAPLGPPGPPRPLGIPGRSGGLCHPLGPPAVAHRPPSPAGGGHEESGNIVFRAQRYAPDYPGLAQLVPDR